MLSSHCMAYRFCQPCVQHRFAVVCGSGKSEQLLALLAAAAAAQPDTTAQLAAAAHLETGSPLAAAAEQGPQHSWQQEAK